jgi:hypothetical protein
MQGCQSRLSEEWPRQQSPAALCYVTVSEQGPTLVCEATFWPRNPFVVSIAQLNQSVVPQPPPEFPHLGRDGQALQVLPSCLQARGVYARAKGDWSWG